MHNPYLRLLRLHQPAGIWLLLFPCWWAVLLASEGLPSLWLLALFGIGAVVMRGAGCIVNDMADREFDRKVERTRGRPLASGEISMKQAASLLVVLLAIALMIALMIALQMNRTVWVLAFAALPLVAAYPFMKRITWWPQAFLGLTFNWGALMGWAAVKGEIGLPALLLYAGGVFWTLGYDTIYAHQDKADDIHAGVKSTALRLGADTKRAVVVFYALATVFWVIAGMLVHGIAFMQAGIILAIHFDWQVRGVNLDDPADCMRTFRSNIVLGWIMLGCLLLSSVLHRFL